MLRRNLSIEFYQLNSPLDEPAAQLAHGELDFDDYLKLYEEIYGTVKKENYAFFRAYYEETFIPEFLSAEKDFEPFKSTGQLTETKIDVISADHIKELLNKGKYIFTSLINNERNSEHAIAIFRPDQMMPALFFTPGQGTDNQGSDSHIFPLDESSFKNIQRSSLGAIALWESAN